MKNRKKILPLLFIGLLMPSFGFAEDLYPLRDARKASPGKKVYYIHPEAGNDANSGVEKNKAWKSYKNVNQLNLAPGDRIEVLAPGTFDQSLVITGHGTKEAPITVHFAPGRYDIFPENILRRQYHISNTNDDPEGQKAHGFLFDGAKHVRVSGPGARFVFRAKMIMVCFDGSEDIGISDLTFDYHRPTVSEFKVIEIDGDDAVIEINKDSTYQLDDKGSLTWIGEGWTKTSGLAQVLNLETDVMVRMGRDPLAGKTYVELEPFRLRTSANNLSLNHIYTIRSGRRDCTGVFKQHSKDIAWKNVTFHFMHGMGVISQFTENITFDTCTFAPDPASGRVTAAWADILHFSGCRGNIVVKDVVFSGANDDAINIHGTHLRVIEKLSERQVKVRFMHRQTFGFQPFFPGDEIEFVRTSLETYAPNIVEKVERESDRDWIITLKDPAPDDLAENYAMENVTWTPSVHVSGCIVKRIPTRGFLFTTRRPVLVENNRFHRTRMAAILIENDAQGWFESGPVRDMTIRNNLFYHTGDPAIFINPHNRADNPAVHENIRIVDNRFLLGSSIIVRAKNIRGLTVTGNRIYSTRNQPEERWVHKQGGTSEVTIENNTVLKPEEFQDDFPTTMP